jgi:FG-GAP repeat
VSPTRDSHAGRAYVLARAPSDWHQVAALKGSDTVPGDYFGAAVAVSGAVVVGALGHAGTGRA